MSIRSLSALIAALVLAHPAMASKTEAKKFCAPKDPICAYAKSDAGPVARMKFCAPKDPICAY
ncbi:hypothetical protein ACPOLB_16045 [Rubrivivax sp. RP6-9]|uniref:hypothetical protein n=1 Tax=Rubrivivax sp. RP6-9 TaxID=3415750 RepID=UPI003CC69106